MQLPTNGMVVSSLRVPSQCGPVRQFESSVDDLALLGTTLVSAAVSPQMPASTRETA